MTYLLCRHKVADFAKWHAVFRAHAEAQRESGLHLLHLLREAADPNSVVMLFRVEDVVKARAFTQAPAARAAGQASGVIGVPEMAFLVD